ncbi:MAG TPA: hypothetical protein VL403_11245, partial [Candidatus Kryptonia bacterium]|nr:hypothetical protein [Candidatus Kryptonia bacterium]
MRTSRSSRMVGAVAASLVLAVVAVGCTPPPPDMTPVNNAISKSEAAANRAEAAARAAADAAAKAQAAADRAVAAFEH